MPFYEYRCSACSHELEVLQKMSDALLVDCPSCGKATLTKMVSAAGFQLKGSGWYVTDFRDGDKSKKDKDKDDAKPKSADKSESASTSSSTSSGEKSADSSSTGKKSESKSSESSKTTTKSAGSTDSTSK